MLAACSGDHSLEEYAARRREELVRAFSAGIAVGVLGRELVRYARR